MRASWRLGQGSESSSADTGAKSVLMWKSHWYSSSWQSPCWQSPKRMVAKRLMYCAPLAVMTSRPRNRPS